jgi:hypothetical protein
MGGFEPPSRTGRTTQGDRVSRLAKGSYRYLSIPTCRAQGIPYGEVNVPTACVVASFSDHGKDVAHVAFIVVARPCHTCDVVSDAARISAIRMSPHGRARRSRGACRIH